jgi:uncharacterized protein YbbK (DUF523 family)
MILISACLCDIHCRYDGSAKPDAELIELLRSGQAVPVCPEQLGGLATPRPSAEIIGGDGAAALAGTASVMSTTGDDVTAAFIQGATQTLYIARICRAERAILKANSPSCGCGAIYDGTFSGVLKEGDGVTAALLKQNGIPVEVR